MSVWPSDYIENVINDVEKYEGIRKTIKAGFIERCAVRYCSPNELHPNPDDEFSMVEVGPNLEIVGNYVKEIQYNLKHGMVIYEEPVIVQKMEPDGYILLNGHHRWFAAIRMRINKIHIKIVNLINEADLNRMIDKTPNYKLASFDFDEVLLSADENNMAPVADSLFARKIKERLRRGAPEVIRDFKEKGYDICVYTAGYFDEEEFCDFFSMYDLDVDIVVNGINNKRTSKDGSRESMRDLIRNKYKETVHVDNESLIRVNHETKEYEVLDFTWP